MGNNISWHQWVGITLPVVFSFASALQALRITRVSGQKASDLDFTLLQSEELDQSWEMSWFAAVAIWCMPFACAVIALMQADRPNALYFHSPSSSIIFLGAMFFVLSPMMALPTAVLLHRNAAGALSFSQWTGANFWGMAVPRFVQWAAALAVLGGLLCSVSLWGLARSHVSVEANRITLTSPLAPWPTHYSSSELARILWADTHGGHSGRLVHSPTVILVLSDGRVLDPVGDLDADPKKLEVALKAAFPQTMFERKAAVRLKGDNIFSEE